MYIQYTNLDLINNHRIWIILIITIYIPNKNNNDNVT